MTIEYAHGFLGGPLAGTFTGTAMELTIPAGPDDCLELACSAGEPHTLCRSGGVFSGAVVNRDSWQGDWHVSFADELGTVTVSGATAGSAIWSTGWNAYVAGAVRTAVRIQVRVGTFGQEQTSTLRLDTDSTIRFQLRP